MNGQVEIQGGPLNNLHTHITHKSLKMMKRIKFCGNETLYG